ncbi:MAG: molecular chaperone [Phycisphaerae bacterium]|nr:MAG: Hsp20/alpha crystallin family protein [Planctomycetia bacterium]GJQ27093.1 MAG: molecular chaperone [Phycisphaerae bacterium]
MASFPFPSDWPFNVQGVRNEVDRLLDRVWHLGLSTAPLDGQDWAPCLDLFEEADRYIVRAELPGMAAEDVSVEMLGQTLSIRGFKAEPARASEKPGAVGAGESQAACRKLRGECRYGSFARKIELPGPVSESGVSATCRNGVLDVTIPKAQSSLGKTVKVSAG